jgi:hypothetical protein
MRGCISETEILKFLDGRLAADAVGAIEEHIDRCGACRQLLAFLAQPFEAAAPLRPTLPHAQAVGPTFAPDELVAERHRIVRFIAEGGMGEVYEAEDTMLGERVALKTVGAALSDDMELAERLKREVQLARRVTHPNVCRIFDVGVHARPSGERIFFMTMELLAGETLGRRLRRAGRLAPRDALPIIVEVAAALDAAHDAGIIHRDLKAENVFLVSEPRGRAVVTDFGLAEMHASREAREQPLIERETVVAGTPHYMAPEQALGQRVTGAADLYAFGVVVYEMVTGRLPFAAGATPFSIVAKRLKFEPEPPEVHAPGLPPRWSRAILRCLARDPADRFARAGEVVLALRSRRRATFAAAGGLGVVLAAGVAVSKLGAAGCPSPLPGEVFVSAVAGLPAARANGSETCPFRTISDGLVAAGRIHGHRVVHVGPGTYDRALGERFPLMVRGDVTVTGAGDEATFVVGTGHFDSKAAGMAENPLEVTVLAGDPVATVELSGMAISSGQEPEMGLYGVIGNGGNVGSSSTTAPPPANTILKNLTLGPGYDVAVAPFVSSERNGSNLRLEHSTVRRSYNGLITWGCGLVDGLPIGVSIEVVDTLFSGIRAPMASGGVGVIAGDCVTRAVVRGCTFRDSDAGVEFFNHAPPTAATMVIEGSGFHALKNYGVWLARAGHLDRLVDNEFMDISGGSAPTVAQRGVGLIIDSVNQTGFYPQVKLARRNTFVNSDVGIELRGEAEVMGTLDFGRPDDPGKNLIRCNATVDGAAVAGHDLLIRAAVDPQARLRFSGNIWDHAPPAAETRNGGDLAADVALPDIDVSGATAARSGCSARIP